MTDGWVPVPGTDAIRGLAVRSPTLPPATHTNVWVLGRDAVTVVDPASPWASERDRLADALHDLGTRVERVLLTHHHHDHVGGAVDLADRLGVPIVAHPATRERVGFPTGDLPLGPLDCGGMPVEVLHTPGHAPGHVVLHDPASGALVAGDMVAGVGTIVIDPDDSGHLGDYLASLERLRQLGPTALLPAHGPILEHPDEVLAYYIAHRHGRTEQIRRALDTGGTSTPLELAPRVYAELDPRFHPLAAVQIRAHLVWMEEAGVVVRAPDGRWQTR